MSDYTLTAQSPLAGASHKFEGVLLHEVTDLAIVSIALPLGEEKAATAAVKKTLGILMPPVGKSALSGDGGTRLVRLGLDLAFAMFSHGTPDAEKIIAAKLNGAAYTTDQTDVWVAVDISGPNVRASLERICPIDLHAQAFLVDDAVRTSMEHLGTIIIRTETDRFLVLSASSSAGSFLHALVTSAKNVT